MVRTISPEITIDTASKPSASTMLWVASRILPTKNGLTYPDRLPTELIHAMPAAAAVPERMAGGSDQKHTIPERAPAVATVSVAISAQPPIWGRALSANAAPLTRHGAATWQYPSGAYERSIDIGNAATPMTDRTVYGPGLMQPDGTMKQEPRMEAKAAGEAVAYMASLPLDANVLFLSVMASKMPFVGRG